MKEKKINIDSVARPSTFALECSILNSLLFRFEKMADLRHVIRREFFSDDLNLRAWDILLDMTSKGQPVDNLTLYHQAADDNEFQRHVINNILDSDYTCSDIDLDKMADNLRNGYIRRVAYDKAARVIDAVATNGNVAATLTDLGDTMKEVGEVLAGEAMVPAGEVGRELAQDISQAKVTRIKTGIGDLDYAIYGGLPSGSLTILAARPSVGKTTIGLQMAQHAAHNGHKVSFFSLEMTAKELAQRLIIATGLVTPSEIASRKVDWDKYNEACAQALPDNLRVIDRATTLEEIRATINISARSRECDIAFIDYLGLVIHEDRYRTLSQSIGEVTKAVKLLAKGCNIPIVLLCQLNRDSAKEKRSPDISDLRDSGNIEQDADIVLMLERPRDGNGDEMDNRIDIWLRKNRNGRRLKDAIMLQGNEYYSNFVETKTTVIYKSDKLLPF